MKRKILYISGSRADYGLMRSVLQSIDTHPDLSLDIVVTGMHLMREFGSTIDEIKEDRYRYHVIDVTYNDDSQASMALFIGRFIQEFIPVIQTLKPDIILILGDRGEMLAGAIVGVYMSIPVAHIHGGEITSTVDDYARHAITKLAHLHFPATKKSALRIKRMGEDSSRIFITGAPGLDQIVHEKLLTRDELKEKYHLDFSQPTLLVVQHPVTLEIDCAADQIRETLEAVTSLKIPTIVLYPNADAGARSMIEVINEYKKIPFLSVFPNIRHHDYISLLQYVRVLIGNSSSAIIEAPSFGLPVLNIGNRQMQRERADNVIDAHYDRHHIRTCIDKAMSNSFREKAALCKNPYGDGNASKRITKVLSQVTINQELLDKSQKKE